MISDWGVGLGATGRVASFHIQPLPGKGWRHGKKKTHERIGYFTSFNRRRSNFPAGVRDDGGGELSRY